MIKITYLDHSGFMVTVPDQAILVFQYYRDPARALHKELEKHPYLPVVFIDGHHHAKPRNYKPDIFEIAQNHERVYILSNDILPQTIPSDLRVAGMSAGDILESLPGIKKIEAFKADEKGIGFVVTLPSGRTIYYAGDMVDENPSDSREAQKEDEHFRTCVNRVATEYPAVDVAMFPVIPEEGKDFGRGAKYLLGKIDVKNFFPMQMGGKFTEGCFGPAYRSESKAEIHCLHDPGQSIELDL